MRLYDLQAQFEISVQAGVSAYCDRATPNDGIPVPIQTMRMVDGPGSMPMRDYT